MSNEAIAEILAGIRSWVEIESQTADPDGVNQTVLLERIAYTVLVDAQPDVVDDRTSPTYALNPLEFQHFRAPATVVGRKHAPAYRKPVIERTDG